jgi:hypothetical protein
MVNPILYTMKLEEIPKPASQREPKSEKVRCRPRGSRVSKSEVD